jgi:hypothetical protein
MVLLLMLLLLLLVQWWSLEVHHYCTVMEAVDWRCCLSVHVLQCSTSMDMRHFQL